MKKCPLCNRAYADDAISFCLADGALLSAPYDAQATEQFPAARSTDPPPTEILPNTPLLNRTRLGREAEPVNSTIASPVAPPVMKEKSRLPWIVGGLFVLIAVGIVFVIGYKMGGEKTGGANDNSSAANPSPNASPEAVAKASPSNSNSIVQNSTANANNSVANRNANVSPAAVDYSKIFKPSEVDQKARIVSKPSPEYTEEARTNQATGTVLLRMVFSASGEVTDIRALSGLPYGLTEKAIAAARKIQFTPAMKDGRPVSQSIQVEYTFNIY